MELSAEGLDPKYVGDMLSLSSIDPQMIEKMISQVSKKNAKKKSTSFEFGPLRLCLELWVEGLDPKYVGDMLSLSPIGRQIIEKVFSQLRYFSTNFRGQNTQV